MEKDKLGQKPEADNNTKKKVTWKDLSYTYSGPELRQDFFQIDDYSDSSSEHMDLPDPLAQLVSDAVGDV